MTVKVELTTEQILAAISRLPEQEQERIAQQIRKSEGAKDFISLSEKIQSEFPQQELPTMDEIQEMVDEVRQEIYNKRKKAG